MKTILTTLATAAAASPALAHADSTFHTHGAEWPVALAILGIIIAVTLRSRG